MKNFLTKLISKFSTPPTKHEKNTAYKARKRLIGKQGPKKRSDNSF